MPRITMSLGAFYSSFHKPFPGIVFRFYQQTILIRTAFSKLFGIYATNLSYILITSVFISP